MRAPACVTRVHEIADGALMHARHAGKFVVAVAERKYRGQRTESRAGVAEEEIGTLVGKACRASDAMNQDMLDPVLRLEWHAQRIEGGAHHARVVGIEE